MKRILKLKRLWLLIFLPAGIIYLLLSMNSRYFAENVAAGGIFKALSQGISSVTGLVPFSLCECILVSSPVWVTVLIVLYIRSIKKHKGERGYYAAKGIVNALCVFGIGFFIFEVLMGSNYYRLSFLDYCPYSASDYDADDLYDMCEEYVDNLNVLCREVERDEFGFTKLNGSFRETAKSADATMDKLAEFYPVLKGNYGYAKPVMISPLWSYTHIIGMYFPFTVESNINTDIADCYIPSTMCHELCHMRGIAYENEANFVGYLASTNSDDPLFRYSGYWEAFDRCVAELNRYDPDGCARLWDRLDDRVIADYAADYYYWQRIDEGKVSEAVRTVSNTVNDTYLKVNGQEDGVKTYSYCVTLMLAEYRYRKNSGM